MFGKRSATSEPHIAAPPAPGALAAGPIRSTEAAKATPAAPVETGRTPFPSDGLGAPIVSPPTAPRAPVPVPTAVDTRQSEAYYETKTTIFAALIEAIDLAQLARLDVDAARARALIAEGVGHHVVDVVAALRVFHRLVLGDEVADGEA